MVEAKQALVEDARSWSNYATSRKNYEHQTANYAMQEAWIPFENQEALSTTDAWLGLTGGWAETEDQSIIGLDEFGETHVEQGGQGLPISPPWRAGNYASDDPQPDGFERKTGLDDPNASSNYGFQEVLDRYAYGENKRGQVYDTRQESLEYWLSNVQHMYEQGGMDVKDMARVIKKWNMGAWLDRIAGTGGIR